jgi:hypothetical protein
VLGVTVTLEPEAENALGPVHVYPEDPVTFRVMLCPTHIVGAAGVIVKTGTGVTPTETTFDVAVPQPGAPIICARKNIAAVTGQN